VDVGTVSSEDVLGSYERQLTEAHRKIAMLEAALERERRAAAQARIASQPTDQADPQEMP
jgi:hypothetical protein